MKAHIVPEMPLWPHHCWTQHAVDRRWSCNQTYMTNETTDFSFQTCLLTKLQMEKRANSVKKQHQKSPQFITSTFSVCHLPCNLPSSEVNLLKFYIFILIRLEIQQGFHTIASCSTNLTSTKICTSTMRPTWRIPPTWWHGVIFNSMTSLHLKYSCSWASILHLIRVSWWVWFNVPHAT